MVISAVLGITVCLTLPRLLQRRRFIAKHSSRSEVAALKAGHVQATNLTTELVRRHPRDFRTILACLNAPATELFL